METNYNAKAILDDFFSSICDFLSLGTRKYKYKYPLRFTLYSKVVKVYVFKMAGNAVHQFCLFFS